MNERILELAEQANKQIRYRICPNTFKHIDDTNGSHIRIEFDKEKFAELIVRECAELLELEYGHCALTGNSAAESIKKHFGIDLGIEE